MMEKLCVVVPNWNGQDSIKQCLDSLLGQSQKARVIVVENASTDNSLKIIQQDYPQVKLIINSKNTGFAAGVNAGIQLALDAGAKYVALFNNDAVADKDWLKNLVGVLDKNPGTGIVTSKIMSIDKKHLDSTGEQYTTWNLPFPRGRGEAVSDKYDNERLVFGASGGASLYRAKMFKQIGLFDQDFFAYYEDVDISFRAQLAGWKVAYQPTALVYHQIGAASSRIKDFTVYHTIKNLPMLYWKNVPWQLMPSTLLRFKLAYWGIFFSAVKRGQGMAALKGLGYSLLLLPKKSFQRYSIRRQRKVPVSYISLIMVHDLPPDAARLRALRAKWWRLRGKTA